MKHRIEHPPASCELTVFEAGKSGFDHLNIALWIFDIDHGAVVWANQAALRLWDAQTEEALYQRDMRKDMSPAVAQRLRQYQDDFIHKSAVFTEMWTLYPAGEPRPLLVRFSAAQLDGGRTGILCEAIDKLDMLPDALRSADALLHTHLMISLHSKEGWPLYLNPAARQAYGKNPGGLVSRFVKMNDYAHLLSGVQTRGNACLIAEVLTSHGRRWHEITASTCHDPVSGSLSVLVSETDVTVLRNAESQAHHLAYHDALTGLPNRQGLAEVFQQCTQQAQLAQAHLGVFVLDLDEFKGINDTAGHQYGDQVLIEVARRIKAIADKAGHQVLRLAGDEFVYLMPLPMQVSEATIEQHVRDLMHAVCLPMQVQSHAFTLNCCASATLWPLHSTELSELMQYADLAMTNAKAQGLSSYCLFHDEMRQKFEDKVRLIKDLPISLEQGHFHVYYQARVATDSHAIVGAEALVRWQHPERGLIPPDQFIPLCEETGLITALGTYVLRQALRERQRLAALGYAINMSVNVSQRQLVEPDFAEIVAKALADTECSSQHLELEITETLVVANDSNVAHNLEQLGRMGVKVSIDDFGTGYSNLARLNEMSVDCLKIDRSLIQQLPRSAEIVKMVIAMCKMMDARLVAEGVETDQQKAWLQNNDCDQMQGFLFGKPIPVQQFEALLAASAKPLDKAA